MQQYQSMLERNYFPFLKWLFFKLILYFFTELISLWNFVSQKFYLVYLKNFLFAFMTVATDRLASPVYPS